jgi:hypothetical protein
MASGDLQGHRLKIVADSRTGIAFTDAELVAAGASAGDTLVAVVFCRFGSARLTCSSAWKALKLGATSDAVVEGSTGTVFDHADDGIGNQAYGASVRPFVLTQPYVVGAGASFVGQVVPSGGNAMAVAIGVTDDPASIALSWMPTPPYKGAAGQTSLAYAMSTGFVPLADFMRFLWFAPPDTNPITVSWGADFQWGDGPSPTIAGDVRGARVSSTLAVAFAAGSANDLGQLPLGDAAVTPSAVGIGGLTITFAAKAPQWFAGFPPTLSGTFQGGKTVTVAPGVVAGEKPITFTYQWYSRVGNGAASAIAGATAATLNVLEGSMVGKSLACDVTATNALNASVTQRTAWSSVVITGNQATPNGTPHISGPIHLADGLAIVNEVLAFDGTGFGWTLNGVPFVPAQLVTQWGRAASEVAELTPGVTGLARPVVSDDITRFLAVRQKDLGTGVESAWSPRVRAIRAPNESLDLATCKPALDLNGAMVPGEPLQSGESTFPPLFTYLSASGVYRVYSLVFLMWTYPEFGAPGSVWMNADTISDDTTVEFALADPDGLASFDPSTPPAILGGWSQPTADDRLTFTIPAAGWVAIARRWTQAQGAAAAPDDVFRWDREVVVDVP